jgi:hypothetical protein
MDKRNDMASFLLSIFFFFFELFIGFFFWFFSKNESSLFHEKVSPKNILLKTQKKERKQSVNLLKNSHLSFFFTHFVLQKIFEKHFFLILMFFKRISQFF